MRSAYNTIIRTLQALMNDAWIMGIGPGKTNCATFYVSVLFSACAKRMPLNSCHRAHGRLRIINQYYWTAKEFYFLLVFVWNRKNEVYQR